MNANIRKHTISAVVALALTGLCLLLALAFTDLSNLWFAELDKPAFLPGGDVLLWCLLGAAAACCVALYLCFCHGTVGGRAALLYALCMALAALWHYIFFQRGYLVYAFYTLVLAIAIGGYACYCMFRRHVSAGLLSLPLLIWLYLLAALNYMTFMLN